MVQSVKLPTSGQVMISHFMGSSPTSSSVQIARSLKPASDSVSPSPSAPSPLMLCLSLSNKQTLKKFFLKNLEEERIRVGKPNVWHKVLKKEKWVARFNMELPSSLCKRELVIYSMASSQLVLGVLFKEDTVRYSKSVTS